jgi:hypothetical protein
MLVVVMLALFLAAYLFSWLSVLFVIISILNYQYLHKDIRIKFEKSTASYGIEHSFKGDHADLQAERWEKGIRQVVVDVESGNQ